MGYTTEFGVTHRHEWKELSLDDAVAWVAEQSAGTRTTAEEAGLRYVLARALGFDPKQKRFACACGAIKFEGAALAKSTCWTCPEDLKRPTSPIVIVDSRGKRETVQMCAECKAEYKAFKSATVGGAS